MVRGEIYWCSLNPTVGREIQKTRPVAVVSPDEVNQYLSTVVVVPITSKGFAAPFRVPCEVGGRAGLLLVDQMRAVDKSRLSGRAGNLNAAELQNLLDVIQEFFS